MTRDQIRDIAKTYGLKTGDKSKADMIRAIQRAEGNFDCFGTALNGECDQMACAWRKECLQPKKR